MANNKGKVVVDAIETQVKGKHEHVENASSTSRPLGITERVLLERQRINGWGTITSALLVDSTQELKQDDLRRALGLLTKRYPLLRMRIKETADEVFFEEMEDHDKVDFDLLDHITADNWVQGTEGELNGDHFDITSGPLWRVKLLKENFSEGKYKNAVVFTFMHVICDALSIFALQRKLLEFLNSLSSGQEVEAESLPLRPPLESLADVVHPSTKEKILFSSFFKFQQTKAFLVKPKNLFLSIYPPVARKDPAVTKKTSLLARSLTEEETKLLINRCKENRCTVHGLITASTHLAIARILHRGKHDLKSPVSLESSYTISLRKDCVPKLSNEEFGAYMTASGLTITVPPVEPNDKQGFWEFARECSRKVHAQLDSGKYRNLPKLYQCVDVRSYCKMSNIDFNEGRRVQILNITNCGALETKQAEDVRYKFAGWYFGLRGTKTSHLFGNNIMTIDGRLYWAVEYFPHVTIMKQAEEVFDSTLEVIKQACQE